MPRMQETGSGDWRLNPGKVRAFLKPASYAANAGGWKRRPAVESRQGSDAPKTDFLSRYLLVAKGTTKTIRKSLSRKSVKSRAERVQEDRNLSSLPLRALGL